MHNPNVKYVAIKKGGHGSVLISRNQVSKCPDSPVEQVVDPTGGESKPLTDQTS